MSKKKQNKPENGNINDMNDITDINDINKFIGKFLEEVGKQFSRNGAINEPIVFGFNIKVDNTGMPVIEKFGNVNMQREKIKLSESREPLVDVIDHGNKITVIAEMPGVDEKDIKINFEDSSLEITASGLNRAYHRVVPLNINIDKTNYSYNYNNGVLEINIRKLL